MNPEEHLGPVVSPDRPRPKKQRDFTIVKGVLSVVAFAAVVFIAATLLNTYVFQSYYVDGTSMTPTLHNQDRLVISKVERTTAGIERQPYIPSRGQIVILDSSVSEITHTKDEQLIKRVIALPGETVRIRDGVVTVFNSQNPNGIDVDKTLGLHLAATFVDGPFDDYMVPPDSVFVMGDNRAEGGSYDSRFFGAVATDKIIGRLWLRVLPITQTGVF
ncbi:MAG TPA: signal peptidase I [Candidatus Saccharimonadales bacterium]|jgi:signal peptidase I|nr:signal peptidase I [Candidatus Saccharimonadales bacterium]